jgi:hypothetical protein
MLNDWQGKKFAASPDTPLWEMSIPGTHDSSARTNHFSYADKCQTWSITEQLNNGIRFLDLRLNYNNDNNRDPNGFTGFDIYHGGFQYATFKPSWYGNVDPTRPDVANVYSEMVNWLKANPTEFVLVNIANTGGTANDKYTDEFWKIVNSVSKGVNTANPALWYLYDVVNGTPAALTYANLKGKFVLIRSDPGWTWNRTGAAGESLGVPCDAYLHNGVSTTPNRPYFRSQNYWAGIGFYHKMDEINAFFGEIQNAKASEQMTFFNWISRGFNGIHGPEYYAGYYNPFLSAMTEEMVDGLPPHTVSAETVYRPPCMGVIVMDFPTTELNQQIIDYRQRPAS